MSHVFRRRPWEVPARLTTPETAVLNRREFLRRLGFAAAGVAAAPVLGRAVEAQAARLRDPGPTAARDLARGLRYREFGDDRAAALAAASVLESRPWRVSVGGLVARPREIDVDDLVRRMPVEERLTRFRCVSGWSMVVPWAGFPLGALVRWAQPLAAARYVRVTSFLRPARAPAQARPGWMPWPYTEGCRIDEALHPLAFVATGMYGHALAPPHGAPLRFVLPWKYGFKSAKAITRIEFTAREPRTFASHASAGRCDFVANVDPTGRCGGRDQMLELPLGTAERRPTLAFNGYGEWLAGLYPRRG